MLHAMSHFDGGSLTLNSFPLFYCITNSRVLHEPPDSFSTRAYAESTRSRGGSQKKVEHLRILYYY